MTLSDADVTDAIRSAQLDLLLLEDDPGQLNAVLESELVALFFVDLFAMSLAHRYELISHAMRYLTHRLWDMDDLGMMGIDL